MYCIIFALNLFSIFHITIFIIILSIPLSYLIYFKLKYVYNFIMAERIFNN